MRQRHLPTLGLSWSHLPTLGPGIWTGSCGNGIFQLSVCGKQLQYCRKRKTPITTTAPVLQREREREREKNCKYYDRCSIAERERENCNYYDRSKYCRLGETAITTTAPILQREKLQLLRPLKYCRQRETAITTTAPVLQREKLQLLRPLRYCRKRELASTTTAPVLQREKLHLLRPPQYCKKRETIIAATLPAWQTERNCKSFDRSSVAETEKLQLLRRLQIKSWKAANLEESRVGRCVVFQPWVLEFWVRIFQLCGCHHSKIYSL